MTDEKRIEAIIRHLVNTPQSISSALTEKEKQDTAFVDAIHKRLYLDTSARWARR